MIDIHTYSALATKVESDALARLAAENGLTTEELLAKLVQGHNDHLHKLFAHEGIAGGTSGPLAREMFAD